ncbi:hypothetical protein TNIN_399661 [Trichonephila inaurata madagascariensis]|uniref:Uncharacterized protein n=1 Tax=Trichonephila inaurata madagascariensis TaxID=2747483 RepID=A0A8X6YPL3_9ARAC|nr:hypothetical protein TNIN_399661 [Trichonephila inaurata madagascariensis]
MSHILEDTDYTEGTLHCLNNMRILGQRGTRPEHGRWESFWDTNHHVPGLHFRTVFTTFLFQKGDGSQTRTFIIIPNISSSMLEVIIQYAYSGITLVSEENVELFFWVISFKAGW